MSKPPPLSDSTTPQATMRAAPPGARPGKQPGKQPGDRHDAAAGQASQASHQGSAGLTLAMATLAFFGGFAGVSAFGPLVPKLVKELSLGPLDAGLLAAVPNLTGALLRIPFGAAVERHGGRKPFLALLGVTMAGMVGLIALLATDYPKHMAGTFPLLLLLGALLGCGIATFSVGIAQVSYWFPHRRQGAALATYAGLGNSSPGLSAILLPVGVIGIGITPAYGVWLAVLVAVTLAYALLAKDAPWFQLTRKGLDADHHHHLARSSGAERGPLPSGSARKGLSTAARRPATWELTFYYFVSFGGFLALTAWLPSYWHSSYSTPLREGGLLTAAFSLLTALIRVPAGMFADRIKLRAPLAVNFALIAAAALVVVESRSFVLSLLATLAIGMGMGMQNAIVFKLVPLAVPDAVGGAAGWVGGLGALGGFVIPLAMATIGASIGGGHAGAHGFVVVAALGAAGLALTAVTRSTGSAHATSFTLAPTEQAVPRSAAGR
ncbi:MAG: MFS transporter [Actinomycetota bacterium]|nr:MFS transporter [Actinomycetota bacterium]